MKKTILIFLIAIASITLVGCGSDSKESDEKTTSDTKNDIEKDVNNYIENSRISAYADTAIAYISAVRTKTNEGKDFKFFDTSILYMVPIGDDDSKSCVKTVVSENPIFGDEWNYGYVGVVFNGTGYNYYFIGEDNATMGFYMSSNRELSDSPKDFIYKEYSTELSGKKMTKEFAEELKETYGTIVKERNLTSDEKKAFAKVIDENKITKILYVDNNCKYETQ